MARVWVWISLITVYVFIPAISGAQRVNEDVKRIVIDDFSPYPVNSTPLGINSEWRVFSLTSFDTQNYLIQEEQGNRFLRARIRKGLDRSQKAVTLIRRVFREDAGHHQSPFYKPKEFPYLSWRWRVNVLPSGSNERIENDHEKRSDSAAGVYIYYQKEGQSPQIIKYIWSESLKKGDYFISPASKRYYNAHCVVLRSGIDGLKEWHVEKVNIYLAFKQIFDQNKEPPRILGIGILTDADSTDTQAAADYDDFILTTQ